MSRGPDGPGFHGRRKGHGLRAGRRRLVEARLPGLRLSLPAEAEGPVDPKGFFTDPIEDLWLEIGFGAGEHLAEQARLNPRVGFLGCEPFVNGVASLVSLIDGAGLANVRIHDDQAEPLFAALPDASVGRLFALFSDPWPKKRHWKRRLIRPENLRQFARILKDRAEVRFATDHLGYIRWTLEQIRRDGNFAWTARRPADWRERADDWPGTRYEKKARAEARQCVYLRFQRRPRFGSDKQKT